MPEKQVLTLIPDARTALAAGLGVRLAKPVAPAGLVEQVARAAGRISAA